MSIGPRCSLNLEDGEQFVVYDKDQAYPHFLAIIEWSPFLPTQALSSYRFGDSVHFKTHRGAFMQITETGAVNACVLDEGSPPNGWRAWERFRIVDAGNGFIALFNVHNRRFLQMHPDGEVNAQGGPSDQPPASWTIERFQVVDAGNGKIALHGHDANRFLRDCGAPGSGHGPIDAEGGVKDADELPPESEWPSERFDVIRYTPLRPGDSVHFKTHRGAFMQMTATGAVHA
jgi:hypothetical protein